MQVQKGKKSFLFYNAQISIYVREFYDSYNNLKIHFFLFFQQRYLGLLHQEIELWGDPEKSVKDYIYIDAVCDAIAQLCVASQTDIIFNIGSSKFTKLSDILSKIEEECGYPLKCKFMNQNPQDTSTFCLDTVKYKNKIGDIKDIPLVEGVRRTMEWYRSII